MLSFHVMINPFNRDLPHIVTMGRDEILQQTPLKTPLEWYQTRMENGLKPMNTGF
ncbi:cag pathogenicity island protein [Helicobacter pylori]